MTDRLRDDLTGLLNRGAFRADLERAIAGQEGVALALLDLDNFLEVNSGFGHDAGDRVLQALAALIQEGAPRGTAYRTGGDEFAVIFPGLTLEQAFLHMEGLRSRIEGARDRFGLAGGRPCTVTIGVAQAPRDARDADGLQAAAEAALYGAKETGRNQVALPPNEEMVMKSCYYPLAMVRRLKALAEREGKKESRLLREALEDLLRKYDRLRGD